MYRILKKGFFFFLLENDDRELLPTDERLREKLGRAAGISLGKPFSDVFRGNSTVLTVPIRGDTPGFVSGSPPCSVASSTALPGRRGDTHQPRCVTNRRVRTKGVESKSACGGVVGETQST
jgi:hypothetical protein